MTPPATAIKAIPATRRIVLSICLLALPLITTACGDVYRPVAQVIPGTPPNPAAAHFVIGVDANGAANPGTASHIDVSGDSNLGAFQTGLMPVHSALVANASKLYIANVGDDTVTENPTSSPTAASVISLAPGATPVFVHTAENANMYVADFGTGRVSVINTTSNAVSTDVPVGANPVALAEMPTAGNSNQKIYVANEGSNSVSVINALDDSLASPILVGAPQIFAVARSDSAHVYVLDMNGAIHDIDTLSDTATTVAVTDSRGVSLGGGANFIAYDHVAQKLYVTNPTNSRVAILDATTVPATVLKVLDFTSATDGAPCPSGCAPVSVTGIGDGSRAYVASYQLATCSPGNYDCINTQVEVINVANSSVSKVIPIASGVPVDTSNGIGQDGCGGKNPPPAPWTPAAGVRFRVSTTASGGGSTSNFKVYVAQCDAQNVAVIDTFPTNNNPADTFAGVTIPSPLSAIAGAQVSISGASQSSTTTTYTYTQSSSTPALQVGQNIFINGMSDSGNNGTFAITGGNLVASGTGTFTVSNPSGVTTTAAQTGTGSVLPRQSPVFMVAGP